MVLLLNAALYVVALSVSLAVLTPMPKRATRRARLARVVLVAAGGLATSAAIILSFSGKWLESTVAGVAAIVVISACMYVALTARVSPETGEDEEEDEGGGGPRKRPDPPAPPEPDDNLWADFDRARAEWEREAVLN